MARIARRRIIAPLLILCAMAAGCSGAARYAPADAARSKAAFLRANGPRISGDQRYLIEQVPYVRSEAQFRRQLQQLAGDGSAANREQRSGRLKLNLADKARENSQDKPGEEPSVDTHKIHR